MKLIPTLALLLLTALPSLARLGETQAECEKRYGKPVKVTDDYINYRKSTMDISIIFFEGKACVVAYMKITANPGSGDNTITEAERTVLLEANKGTSEWNKEPDDGTTHRWQRADKGATAQLSPDLTKFSFSTPDYGRKIKKEKADKEQQEAKKLDGF